MRHALIAATLVLAAPALAQVPPAPAAGSGGGGPVGPSVSEPTSPTGKTPPGTPSATTPADQIARDSTGQQIIGRTTTPQSPVPGNTGGQGTGAQPPVAR